MDLRIKRIYESPASSDGYRVLVDRLWPRGVSKREARLDRWDRDVAPSAELRRAWHAESNGRSPEGFAAFARDYQAELQREPAASALAELIEAAREHSPLTLIYAAKDERVNHAVVLRDVLSEWLGE